MSVLVPRERLILDARGEKLAVRDCDGTVLATASGRMADALVDEALGRGSQSVLKGLPAGHPIANILARVTGAGTELSQERALELGGFGMLFVELVGRCNERCRHCYASSGPEMSAALSEASCEEILVDAKRLGFGTVQFTGGDPLLCGFLPALCERARELGLDIEIYTNGLALTDRLLSQLAPHGVAFAFSFYSHDETTHDDITQTPGSCKRTIAGIKRALAAGLRVRVSVVVMEANQGHEQATAELLSRLGVENMSVTGSFAVGRGCRFKTANGFGAAHVGQQGEAVGGDRAQPRGRLCVTYDGLIVPCIFNRGRVLGDVRTQRLFDVVRTPPPRRLALARPDELAQSLSCADCRLTDNALALAEVT